MSEVKAQQYEDMTQGNPMKVIFLFSIPLLIGNVFQQIYSVVDTMVAGYCLGDDAIAAIGATASLYFLLMQVAIGLNSGCTIVATRFYGAHNVPQVRKSIAGTYMLNGVLVVLVTVLSQIFMHPMLHLLKVPEAIYGMCYSYTSIVLWGLVATLLYNMYSGILRAFGDSKTALYFLVIASVVNVVLDLLFVINFHMGISGTALATVLSQLLSGVLAAAYTYKKFGNFMPRIADFRVELSLLWELFTFGLSTALMGIAISLGSVIFQSSANSLGQKYLTSFTASRRWFGFFNAPYGSLGIACTTFVGQNWGAGKLERIKGVTNKIYIICELYTLICIAVSFLFGRELIQFISGTADPEIIHYGYLGMCVNAAFYIFLPVLTIERMVLQAEGHKIAPVISSSTEMLIKIVAAIWIIPAFGYMGMIFAEPVSWLVCGAYMQYMHVTVNRKLFGPMAKKPESI